MNSKTNSGIKKGIVNFFGGLGYLSVVMQWLWVVLMYFSVLQGFITFMIPEPSQTVEPVHQVATFEPNIFTNLMAIIITAGVFALTFYMIYKVPATIVKTSKKVVRQTATSAAPLILQVQHKKETKRANLKLTAMLILVIKFAIISLPIVLTFTSRFLEKQSFDFNVALFISLISAGCSLVLFLIQYSLAGLFKIDKQEVW